MSQNFVVMMMFVVLGIYFVSIKRLLKEKQYARLGITTALTLLMIFFVYDDYNRNTMYQILESDAVRVANVIDQETIEVDATRLLHGVDSAMVYDFPDIGAEWSVAYEITFMKNGSNGALVEVYTAPKDGMEEQHYYREFQDKYAIAKTRKKLYLLNQTFYDNLEMLLSER